MGPERKLPNRIDVGTMEQKSVKRLLSNFITQWRYNISDNEYAIDLRKYSKTTQILIKSKWDIDRKDWMGYDSKVFFRLWRFVFRDLQRNHGFETDIDEYDEFVRKWKLLRLRGDYVIVKKKEDKDTGIFSNWIHESNREQDFKDTLRKNTELANRAFNTASRQSTPHLHRERLKAERYTAINRFRNMVMSDNDMLDNYMGVTIHDEQIMQGLYNTLMAYEEKLSEPMFRDRWETLRIINGTDLKPEYYWGSDYGYIHNSMIIDVCDPRYLAKPLSLYSSQSVSCDVETITTTHLPDGKTHKWSFTHQLWESINHCIDDYKYKMTDIKREDFNPFEEFMFRFLYYYPMRGVAAHDILLLPKCSYVPSQKFDEGEAEFIKDHGGFLTDITDRERDEVDMYRRKLQSLTETPHPPFSVSTDDVGPYQIKKVNTK